MTTSARISDEQYGEWPDYVEEVVAGEIWLRDPFCPGPGWVDTGELWQSRVVANYQGCDYLILRKWVKRNA